MEASRPIESVTFKILPNSEEFAGSSATIDNARLSTNNNTGGTLFDSGMGVNNDSQTCATCMNKQMHCPKHFGTINLCDPIYNPSKFALGEIYRFLNVICWKCGSLRVDDPKTILRGYDAIPSSMKLAALSAAILGKTDTTKKSSINISHCDFLSPRVVYEKVNKAQFYAYFPDYPKTEVNKVAITPMVASEVFTKITRQTLKQLGKSAEYDPLDLIRRRVHVLPVHLRNTMPPIPGGRSTLDPITKVLVDIIRNSNDLQSIINSMPQIQLAQIMSTADSDKSRFTYEAQQAYLDKINSITNAVHAIIYGRAIWKKPNVATCDMSISAIVNGKTGIFRHEALSSRMHNRARGVIYNATNVMFDEVLIPVFFAIRLYILEVVTEQNFMNMRQLLINGKRVHPGCLEIIKSDGKKYLVEHINANTFDLELGDKVKRHIINGDYVMMNRQPSVLLSNLSLFRVRINPDPNAFAFGINIGICDLFNADFDGDQMTMLIFAQIGALVECKLLSEVKTRFISHQFSTPVFGMAQDSLALMAELTRDGITLTRSEAMSCMENIRGIYPMNKPVYTGRELVSLILPDFDYRGISSMGASPLAKWVGVSETEKNVVIENGNLISGVLDKKSIASTKTSLFHVVYAYHGIDTTMTLLYNIQQLAFSYGQISTFSTGPRDFFIVNPDAKEEIQNQIRALLIEAEDLIDAFQNGKLSAPPDKTVKQHFEDKMIALLKVQPYEILTKTLTISSALLLMIMYESRGSPDNMLNMCGTVGQTLVDGSRPLETFDYGRTDPFSHRCDQRPEVRGYVTNSYAEGLTPRQAFNNSRESRDKIIKKAFSVVTAGATSRLLVRSSESNVLSALFIVMRHQTVVQWSYGDCNLDAAHVAEYRIPSISMSDDALRKQFAIPDSSSAALKNTAAAEIKQLIADRDDYRALQLSIEMMMGQLNFTDRQKFPLNLEMFVTSAIKRQGGPHEQSAGQVLNHYAKVSEFINRLHRRIFSESLKDEAVPIHSRNAARYFEIYIRNHLCLRNLMQMDEATVDAVLMDILARYRHALEAPGAAVGIEMASAVSEPITQRALDSAHVIGDSRMTGYSMPSIRNFMAAVNTTALGLAAMWARLKPEIEHDAERAEIVAKRIQLIALRDFVTEVHLFYETFGQPVHPKYAAEAEIYTDFAKQGFMRKPANITNFCIRFVLNRQAMLVKGITMIDIVNALYRGLPSIYIIHTTENNMKFPLQLRIHLLPHRTLKSLHNVHLIRNTLMNCVIRGIRGIRHASAMPFKVTTIEPDGSVKLDEVYIIRTLGSNMIGLLAETDIVPESIETNSIVENEQILGLNRTRARIMQEWVKINGSLNRVHYILIADNMTSTGKLTPLNRAGVLMREFNNVLLNCGIGYPMAVMMKAATNNVKNDLYGLSSNLIMGQTVKLGTGYVNCGLMIDAVKEMSAETKGDYADMI